MQLTLTKTPPAHHDQLSNDSAFDEVIRTLSFYRRCQFVIDNSSWFEQFDAPRRVIVRTPPPSSSTLDRPVWTTGGPFLVEYIAPRPGAPSPVEGSLFGFPTSRQDVLKRDSVPRRDPLVAMCLPLAPVDARVARARVVQKWQCHHAKLTAGAAHTGRQHWPDDDPNDSRGYRAQSKKGRHGQA